MKFINICILIFTICSVQCTFGTYTDKSNVINLTNKNFQKQVMDSEHGWLVEFYAPWCGHCKKLEPEYEKLSNNVKGIAKIGAINCDDEKELCGQHQIKGFPTLKYFPTNPKTGKKGMPEDYNGGRTASEMAKFVLSKLPNHSVKVTDSSISKFLSSTPDAKALLFSNKPTTSDLYKALSVDFRKTLPLGEARNLNKEILEKYEIKTFPTLLVFTSDDESTFTKFEGKLDHANLYKFLKPFSKQSESSGTDSNKSEKEPVVEEKEPALLKFVQVNDQKSFDKICSTGLCVVALFDQSQPEEKETNDKYLSLLNELVEKDFSGKMKFVLLDSSVHDKVATQFDISGVPNVFIINSSKKVYVPFFGSFSTDSLSNYFKSVLSGTKRAIPFDNSPKLNDQPTKKTTTTKKSKDEL